MSPRHPVPVPPGGARMVAVIGAGYVGLPTAATLSHFGHRVVCADSDPVRFDALSRCQMPIVEEGLEDLVREGLDRGTLRFVQRADEAVAGAEFVFLCVPTPQGDDGSADLSYVEAVSKEIASALETRAVVVNKSTVPVGSAHLVGQIIGRGDVAVVSNPEFLREGSAVRDSLRPDRLVVGADDHAAAARVGELFATTGAPMIVTDTTTSETIKYASNAFLATKLTFINAVAGLCEAVGADVRDVILGLGYDKRIGFEYLKPGPGWGGSCLPKDTRALVHMADTAGYDFSLLRGAIAGNDEQLERVVGKITFAVAQSARRAVSSDRQSPDRQSSDRQSPDRQSPDRPATERDRPAPATGASGPADPVAAATGGSIEARRVPEGRQAVEGRVVAVWGLTFKANTDDRRNSPALDVAQRLVRLGATVQAFDPTVAADGPAHADLDGITVCADPFDAARQALTLVVLTEWEQFRWVDFTRVRDVMAVPSVVDARNLLDPAALRRLGFTYIGIGRP